MKRIILDFLHRGLITCGFGPMVLAVIFLSLQKNIGLETITINEYAISIFSSAILAFISTLVKRMISPPYNNTINLVNYWIINYSL